ncbi:HIRAN domain-containing protein [Sphingomonas aracearum]|nr:HIRAN domain-containing protein [Sphingomonas aracearum]
MSVDVRAMFRRCADLSPNPEVGAAPRELSLAIVGLDHPNADGSNRRFEVALCEPGHPVCLVPEPKNPVDPHAVAVLSMNQIQLGYIPFERSGWISTLLSAGERYEAFFQDHGRCAAIIRVRFGGGPPTMPAPRYTPPQPIDPADLVDWGA